MFSTDRSEAKTCECVALNNLYVSKSGAFNHDIIMYRYIKINRIVKIGLKAGGIYENPPDINFIPAFHMRDFCVRAHLTQTRYALKTCEAQT